MILVLLGTQNKPFSRILKKVENLKKENKIKDKIIAQTGCTNYSSDYIETFISVTKDKLFELMDEARIIITHGGVGTIIECLNKNKKVIVVPRLKKYREHTNDHQIQITKEFAEKGYVIPLLNDNDLLDEIKNISKFNPNKYESNAEKFKENLILYIDSL